VRITKQEFGFMLRHSLLPCGSTAFLKWTAEVMGAARLTALCSVMLSQAHCRRCQASFHCLTSCAVLGWAVQPVRVI